MPYALDEAVEVAGVLDDIARRGTLWLGENATLVLHSLIAQVYEHGLSFTLSQRELMQLCKIPHLLSVQRALTQLEKSGWIAREHRARVIEGADVAPDVITLRVPAGFRERSHSTYKKFSKTHEESQDVLGSTGTSHTCTMTTLAENPLPDELDWLRDWDNANRGAEHLPLASDLPMAERMITYVLHRQPMTRKQLVEVLTAGGAGKTMVYAKLKRLLEMNFVMQHDGVLYDTSLDYLPGETDTMLAHKIAMQVARQRVLYRMLCKPLKEVVRLMGLPEGQSPTAEDWARPVRVYPDLGEFWYCPATRQLVPEPVAAV